MMRVLIIKTAPLGELLPALPVLDYLHQAVPEIEVDWVVDESIKEVLEDNPLVDSLHVVRIGEWLTPRMAMQCYKEVTSLKETLQARGYDIVFDLEGTLASGFISRLAGGKDRIGFQREDVKDRKNMLFSMRRVPLRRLDNHASLRCLRLVSVPFAKDFREMELSSTIATAHDDDLSAEALLATLSDGLVFLFDCTADAETKLWTEQGWKELGKQVLDSFPESTILFSWGSDSGKAVAAGIAKSLPGARLLDQHTMMAMAALLKKVDLVVGGDNDTVQLAAAVGTPTVSFYRATDGRTIGPRGQHHVVVQSPIHCARCLRTRCDKNAQCRGTIKVEALLAGIESLLGS
jgi:heptosyltransferase I